MFEINKKRKIRYLGVSLGQKKKKEIVSASIIIQCKTEAASTQKVICFNKRAEKVNGIQRLRATKGEITAGEVKLVETKKLHHHHHQASD